MSIPKAWAPNRSVGAVCRELLEGVRSLVGAVEIDLTPQEVSWKVPLDEDEEHASWDREQVACYLAAATQAALVLAEFRAPYRGRSTPVNAWWGSFDLAVSLFSGASAQPPSDGFIPRNSMDAQEIAVGWWPGGRELRTGRVLFIHPPRSRRLRERHARSAKRALGAGTRRVHPRRRRRARHRKPA